MNKLISLVKMFHEASVQFNQGGYVRLYITVEGAKAEPMTRLFDGGFFGKGIELHTVGHSDESGFSTLVFFFSEETNVNKLVKGLQAFSM